MKNHQENVSSFFFCWTKKKNDQHTIDVADRLSIERGAADVIQVRVRYQRLPSSTTTTTQKKKKSDEKKKKGKISCLADYMVVA
jgi:hypothetical protein